MKLYKTIVIVLAIILFLTETYETLAFGMILGMLLFNIYVEHRFNTKQN